MTHSGPGLRPRPADHELTSLDERLGLLLIVRITFVILVVMGALFASGTVGVNVTQVAPVSAAFLVVAAAAEAYRRTSWRARMLVHRAVLPLDAIYLAVAQGRLRGRPQSVPDPLRGAAHRAVTLLASGRAVAAGRARGHVPLRAHAERVPGPPGWPALLGVHRGPSPPACRPRRWPSPGSGPSPVAPRCSPRSASAELRRSKAEMAALAQMASGLERLRRRRGDPRSAPEETLVGAFPLRAGGALVRPGQPAGRPACPDGPDHPDRRLPGAGPTSAPSTGSRSPRPGSGGSHSSYRRLNPATEPAAA